MVACCGALGRWCPALAGAEWLPGAVYPFAVVFGGDALCCFETLASVLGRWARGWLACWPEPPLPMLAAVEEVLEALDPELSCHLKSLDCPATAWAWPLLRSMLSEALPKRAWLRVWDALLSAPDAPELLLLSPVALAMTCRGSLRGCATADDVKRFVRAPLACGDDAVLRTLKRLGAVVQADSRLSRLARGEPDDALADEAVDGSRLARGLASIARDANESYERFPFPLPRDAPYPAIAYYPRRAVDFARRG